jgi:hypothetical protein
MTSELTTTPRSRRHLLAAAVGAAAAAVAASVARVNPAAAADGDTALVGTRNEAESTTIFATENAWALQGTSTNTRGVYGLSVAGQGVHGESTQSAGVSGVSAQGNGVHGTSTDNRGVWGESSNGVGVDASGTTGVRAASETGLALHTTSGRVRFDGISGVAVIPGGSTEVDVPQSNIDRNTFVLLTPKANINQRTVWYTVPTSFDHIRIHISGSRTNDTPVAYLILEHTPPSS